MYSDKNPTMSYEYYSSILTNNYPTALPFCTIYSLVVHLSPVSYFSSVGLNCLRNALLILSEHSTSVKALLEACSTAKCCPTLVLIEVPSRAGSLSVKTEGRLGL
ncbi:hypothetical protein ILYODFUR_038631 [Ilyodon furcidens]|uniref:Uncharacterized protein n=1 Tax=Ilyodon furcidens TaxID=33524 RepID=A0ABV0VCG8_9TELE